jgi:two-component system nitrogen regulation sensor histidine kinase NtrY
MAGAAWAAAGATGQGSGLILAILITSAGVLVVTATRAPAGGLAMLLGVVLVFIAAIAVTANSAMSRIGSAWPSIESELRRSVANELELAVAGAADWAKTSAARALRLPNGQYRPFRELDLSLNANGGAAERGIVVYRDGRPWAWTGTVRQPVESLTASLGVAISPFYISLYASADSGNRRAVALQLLHAEEPGDALARATDALLTGSDALARLSYAPQPVDSTWHPIVVEGRTLLAVQAVPLAPGEFRQRRLERARARVAALLGVGVILLLGIAWRQPSSLTRRLVAVGLALGVIAVFPLNTLSNRTAVFDPTYFFVPGGGPFTASVGALAISSALVLLVLFPLLRARFRVRRRWVAALVTALVAAISPYLLRRLSNGITPPAVGEGTALWLAWETALFLAGAAVLLIGSSAGRTALGARRGISPWIAPAIAAVAAGLAPALWRAPVGWPEWYTALWIAAIAALLLSRRAAAAAYAAAFVAACGATTLVWAATIRHHVAQATHDVTLLTTPDPAAAVLLERLAAEWRADSLPKTRAQLLRRYMQSDLSAAGYPIEIAYWPAGSLRPSDALMTAEFERVPARERTAVDSARRTGAVVLEPVISEGGAHWLLALADSLGNAVTVTVSPRTRRVTEDPYSALIGLAPLPVRDPPYTLRVSSAPPDVPSLPRPSWQRRADELHGDWVRDTLGVRLRAHVEVELRSADALLARGILVILLNMALFALLGAANLAADGALGRWLSGRLRHWSQSYQARLTLVLFGFFVVPAVVFAVWSYRRLQRDHETTRAFVVREALRLASSRPDMRDPQADASVTGLPLLAYRDGALTSVSDPLYRELAPIGRFLDPPIAQSLMFGDEATASKPYLVGQTPTLFGFRALDDGAQGRRTVVATAARGGELDLDRQRRDLTVLVLVVTALGALAALALSWLAARQFQQPIGTLRQAALAIAGGEREPVLEGRRPPPTEFQPVFQAFRHMATDLAASERALEEAQHRTEAVLRNVASAVVAVGPQGRVATANTRAEHLLGAPMFPGAPIDVLPPVIRDHVKEFLGGFEPGREFEADLRGRQLRGRLTRLTRGAAAGAVVLTVDDVTEVAHAQRVLAWGEMARQVAHEIKNPLTPIRLGVQHLRRAFHDRNPDYARILEQNVGRILAEIDRLDEIARAFSRYGGTPDEAEELPQIDVGPIVRDVVDLEKMGEGEVAWSVEGDEVTRIAHAREDELREVLLNIMENARQARATRVNVAVGREGRHVIVRIRDDGDGIPEEALSSVFEPHFSTRTSGSGLGLAISRRLVESWGGGIALSSRPGEGTEVRVELVAAPGEHA